MKKDFEYKGYFGSAEIDVESKVLVGKLLFITDTIAYSATTILELETAFREAVEDYVSTCAELGDAPDTPFKGSFNVRVGSERHRGMALEARRRGITLNEAVGLAFDMFLGDGKAVRHIHQHDHQHTVNANVVVKNATTTADLEPLDDHFAIHSSGEGYVPTH